ncbi:MAG: hypothetical protein ACTSYA_11930 [Candidatus Kariarchaeaceae archaeon]
MTTRINPKRAIAIVAESKEDGFFLPNSSSEIQAIKEIVSWKDLKLDQLSENAPIELITLDRCKLALYAVMNGTPPVDLIEHLKWQEFEILTTLALKEAGFETRHRLRFTSIEKKWLELDVLGWKKPYVLLIDCKRYKRRSGKTSGLKKALEEQKMRLEDFTAMLPEIHENFPFTEWEYFIALPILTTWLQEDFAIYDDMALVPFDKLNSFVLELDEWRSDLYNKRYFNLV